MVLPTSNPTRTLVVLTGIADNLKAAPAIPEQAPAEAVPQRIHVIDNLRGAALVGIVLLHGVQHFGLYDFPDPAPGLRGAADAAITYLIYLLFFGKAYGIFALLFGVSYHIQQRNNARKGIHHGRRMLLRMTWLFVFGTVLGLFYPGEILCILAVYGVLLTLIAGLPSSALLVIAVILSLQPVLLFNALHQGSAPMFDAGGPRLDALIVSLRDDPFPRMVINNAWNNRITEWMLMFSTGRIVQLGAWMMVGVAAARRGWFDEPARYRNMNAIMLLLAAAMYMFLAFGFDPDAGPMVDLLARWKEAMLVVVYVCLAMLLAVYWWPINTRTVLATFGRMSLTNYVGQGILGSVLFYGYGAGLYRLGGILSVLAGVGILVLLFAFSMWWSRRNVRGPLEELWATLSGRRAI